MKKCVVFSVLVAVMGLISLSAHSQSSKSSKAPTDTAALGMAGDNLDLYAVLDLFLKSKTIEEFEKKLNDTKSKINNLDLDLDGKIDFIKVVTKKDGDAYTFVLQDPVSKTETQDVAIILVNRDKDKKVTVQMVGDPDLYGKDYVIEPRTSPSVTANPAYQGTDPVVKDVPASTTTVVVQSAPVVQYVYSPAYVPYYPPYYYGFYPPYFAMATCIAVGIYRHNNWYHHGGYYGGHYGGGNTVIINNNNRNQINHYNNTRNTSNRVQHNNANGSYGNGNRGNGGANRPSNGASASQRPSNGGAGGNRPSNGASASQRPSNSGPSVSNRQSGSGFNNASSTGRSRNSSYGGGGSSGFSGSRGGGGGGGFSRGGGGGGGRRR